jgi:hypothetical protein
MVWPSQGFSYRPAMRRAEIVSRFETTPLSDGARVGWEPIQSILDRGCPSSSDRQRRKRECGFEATADEQREPRAAANRAGSCSCNPRFTEQSPPGPYSFLERCESAERITVADQDSDTDQPAGAESPTAVNGFQAVTPSRADDS